MTLSDEGILPTGIVLGIALEMARKDENSRPVSPIVPATSAGSGRALLVWQKESPPYMRISGWGA